MTFDPLAMPKEQSDKQKWQYVKDIVDVYLKSIRCFLLPKSVPAPVSKTDGVIFKREYFVEKPEVLDPRVVEVEQTLTKAWRKIIREVEGEGITKRLWARVHDVLYWELFAFRNNHFVDSFDVVCDASSNPPSLVHTNGIQAFIYWTYRGRVYHLPLNSLDSVGPIYQEDSFVPDIFGDRK